MIVFLIISLFILLILGLPIYISLSLSSLLSILLFMDVNIGIVAQKMFAGIDKFVLMAVPFYIFAAEIMISGDLAKRLLDWVNSFLRCFRGSHATATQLACTCFGALSGSSPATVIAIGSFMYPELVDKKYGRKFSAGLIASSGSVAILIPPSVTLLIYSAVTQVSVAALFLGGVGAGIVYSLCIIAYCYYYVRQRGNLTVSKIDWQETWQLTKKVSWALGIPVVILGGIFFGVFTPTEAAGVSVVYSLFVTGIIYRKLTMEKLYKACLDSVILIAQIMILLAAASIFGWVVTVSFVPQKIMSIIMVGIHSKYIFLLLINFVFLITGMFMDPGAALMVITPLILSPAIKLGIDPVHLGVLLTANLCIGMFSPPFGLNLFVANSITGLQFSEMVSAIIPFFIVCLIALIIITYLPEVTLLLPRLAGY